jgi:hypothetical protein
MIHRIAFVVTVCACWAGHATVAAAQDSDAFRRERQSLDREYERLDRKSLELRLRSDALNARDAAARAEVARINAMAPGIGREAATRGFYRKKAEREWLRDQLNVERQRFRADVADYNRRDAELVRRVRAANQANTYRAGEYVWAEWRGRWWYAQILRAERGRYYIDWPGYGDEWNEWVGPNRLRR